MGNLFASGGTVGYPGALDTHTTQVDGPDALTFGADSSHASKINNLAIAAEAIEAELGLNPSDAADDTVTPADAASTVLAKLNMILQRIKGIIGGAGWKDAIPASLTALNNSLAGKASTTHKATHVSGGSDALLGGDLLDATARVAVRKNTGADVGSRRRLNLIEGSNVTLTVADDAAGEEVDITIAAGTAGHKATHVAGGGDAFVAGDLLDATAKIAVRKNTGSNVGSRRRLNLIEGTNITLTVVDDGAGEEVDVTIASAGAGNHKDSHKTGGSDAFVVTDLIDGVARTAVRKNTGGADVGTRRRLNFIEGAGILITAADDSTDEEIDLTIAGSYFPGQCQLVKDGTNLRLNPFDGNKIIINSVVETIPDAGVALGVGGLSASTTYNIYAYMNTGTMTLEASATARATQAGTGVQIKSGDATRTLVGKARTNGSTAWVDSSTQRFVISWFNRQRKHGLNFLTADHTVADTTTFQEVDSTIRVEFLDWGFDALLIHLTWVHATSTDRYALGSLGFDGATAQEFYVNAAAATGAIAALGGNTVAAPVSEGYHDLRLLEARNATGGTGPTVKGSGTVATRTAFGLFISG